MAVILDLDVRVFLLDLGCKPCKEGRTAYAGHVLKADFIGSVFHQMVHDAHIVLDGMDGGIGNGERRLGDHPCLLGIFDAELEVAMVVESAERAGDVGALGLLDLEHQFTHVGWYRVHTQGVQSAFQHVCLDSCLVEGGRPFANRDVRVLSVEEVDLLEGSTVGFHTVEASHIYNGRGHSHELVDSGLILARRLPHIPVNQGKLYFFCHSSFTSFPA